MALVGEGARISRLLEVTKYQETKTLNGHTSIEAVVEFNNANIKPKGTHRLMRSDVVQLFFRFERTPFDGDESSEVFPESFGPIRTVVRYRISLSRNYQQAENILEVLVLSPGEGPGEEMKNLECSDDEKSEEKAEPAPKKAKTDHCHSVHCNGAHHHHKGEPEDQSNEEQVDQPDRCSAHLDEEVLEKLRWETGAKLSTLDLQHFLLYFSFFEEEWDIIGILLADDDDEITEEE